ncbi:AAA family ATPase [uncultured Maribacter sp.]|uniref:AAA family ATPase n=1 Tax=uncultured Maribacter sp. TaxID=431308 RepID=UPI0030D90483|tara:strand:- start:1940 stop:3070 length:1131 start_codon:yes stop_codon:yes gene_type:complete
MNPKFNDEILKKGAKASKGLTTAEVTAQILADAEKAKSKKGLFILKKASQWIDEAKNRPTPKMLFSEFWHEGELCILFADTNVGKSILAVQIGNSIALGEPLQGFKMDSEKQKILYLDFELSDKQFEVRYSLNYKNHYQFIDNFLRAEIDPDTEGPEGKFEEFLHASLDAMLNEEGVKILIVDNITYLSNETEKAKDALPLMKQLKKLKTKYNLSILALAHTPKRDQHKAITKNDLQGSKMLINFCDSSFAIGECETEKGARYLKQIKARNTEFIFDSKNVAVCQIAKPNNFLMFQFQYYGNEFDLLMNRDNSFEDKRVLARQMKEEGHTIYDIAEKLGISKTFVSDNTKDITQKKGRNRANKNDENGNDSTLNLV